MYAVIQTGGKQYRVQAGDVLVVEKLAGEPGAEVAFDKVLMLGGEGGVTVGAPLVDGAVVTATLIETRKGAKIKVFKKIRRQGYRRTNGHRQPETRAARHGPRPAPASPPSGTATVDLTPRSELVARARGLARHDALAAGAVEVEPFFEAPAPNLTRRRPRSWRRNSAARLRPRRPAPRRRRPRRWSSSPWPRRRLGAQTSVDADAASETGSMAAEEAARQEGPRQEGRAASDDVGFGRVRSERRTPSHGSQEIRRLVP